MTSAFYKLIGVIFILITITGTGFPCTTAIISGKFTADGRPLLYKHRDSGFEQNALMYFNDGKYNYVGLINSSDSLGNEVWAGYNSAGFAIMNSASYNLKPADDTTKVKDLEGVIMKLALKSCATLADFERLLTGMPKPLGVEANFGVIDGQGGAAYYETNNFTFKKIDASDPAVAPFGYIIRTNYSFSGDRRKGYGFIRYKTASELFYQAAAENRLSAPFLLSEVSRCLYHSLTKTDLSNNPPADEQDSRFVPFLDYIPRRSSVATMVVHGVQPGQNPREGMVWTVAGFPFTAVAVPHWPAAWPELPRLLTRNEQGVAPLCDWSLKLKKRCFPVTRGSGYKYLDISKIINQAGSGIWQQLSLLQDQIFHDAQLLDKERRSGEISKKEIIEFYDKLDEIIWAQYRQLLEQYCGTRSLSDWNR